MWVIGNVWIFYRVDGCVALLVGGCGCGCAWVCKCMVVGVCECVRV